MPKPWSMPPSDRTPLRVAERIDTRRPLPCRAVGTVRGQRGGGRRTRGGRGSRGRGGGRRIAGDGGGKHGARVRAPAKCSPWRSPHASNPSTLSASQSLSSSAGTRPGRAVPFRQLVAIGAHQGPQSVCCRRRPHTSQDDPFHFASSVDRAGQSHPEVSVLSSSTAQVQLAAAPLGHLPGRAHQRPDRIGVGCYRPNPRYRSDLASSPLAHTKAPRCVGIVIRRTHPGRSRSTSPLGPGAHESPTNVSPVALAQIQADPLHCATCPPAQESPASVSPAASGTDPGRPIPLGDFERQHRPAPPEQS